MANYIDIVVVRQNGIKYLLRAPAWEAPADGTRVIFETAFGSEEGEVIASVTVGKDSDELNFVAKLFGEVLPLKRILTVMKPHDYDYPDEEAEAHTGLPETE